MSLPILHAIYLAVITASLAATTSRGRFHPFLALLLASVVFAVAAGMSGSQMGKSFGTGFGLTVHGLGLPVLAAAMVAAMAAPVRPAVHASAPRRAAILTALGLAAGTGTGIAPAFAVLSPLRSALQGDATAWQRRGPLTLALALSAGQGFLLPSPVLIAAVAILAADWLRVLAFGLPFAVFLAAVGAGYAALAPAGAGDAAVPARAAAPGARHPALALAVACLVMAALLVVQSVGDMPSEPLGGGAARELIIGSGRPLMLLLAGAGLMAALTGAWRDASDSAAAWPARAIAQAAPLILLLGAAGGLQGLAQTAHMAEMLAEGVLPLGLGLAVPFLAAAIMKTVQGSSLVAAITAAGMVQPLLAALGLDGENGRAFAVLAVGAGAMTAAHVNDMFFWLVADAAALRPACALRWLTVGTLLQGLLALAALAVLHALF